MKKSNLSAPVRCIVLLFLFFVEFPYSTLTAQQDSELRPGIMAGQASVPAGAAEEGLLFYLPGDKEFTPIFTAGGQQEPNFLRDVTIIPEDRKSVV